MSAAHTYKTRSWKARVGEPLNVEADVASGRHVSEEEEESNDEEQEQQNVESSGEN